MACSGGCGIRHNIRVRCYIYLRMMCTVIVLTGNLDCTDIIVLIIATLYYYPLSDIKHTSYTHFNELSSYALRHDTIPRVQCKAYYNFFIPSKSLKDIVSYPAVVMIVCYVQSKSMSMASISRKSALAA